MGSIPFQPSRADGRSDREVIYRLFEGALPERTFTFSEIEQALGVGLTTPPTRGRVYTAVRQGGRTLLKRQRRTVRTVRGVGYRICRADEHLPLALGHEDAARRKVRQGLDVLRHVREDELTPAQRDLNRGTLLMFAGLAQAIDAVRERQDRQENAIRRILRQLGNGDALPEVQS
ncbi:MAG: hypothetical protein ACRDJE_16950 [Dehalococcoidia bacterium]